jgi:hypothetical protein
VRANTTPTGILALVERPVDVLQSACSHGSTAWSHTRRSVSTHLEIALSCIVSRSSSLALPDNAVPVSKKSALAHRLTRRAQPKR